MALYRIVCYCTVWYCLCDNHVKGPQVCWISQSERLHFLLMLITWGSRTQKYPRPWPNDQKLLVQHCELPLQQMFHRFATFNKNVWQTKVTKFEAWCFWKSSTTFYDWREQGRAMLFNVAKRSNILLDRQISNVGPTMFDRLARP